MRACGRGADAGFRTDLLGRIERALLLGLLGIVELRDEVDRQERGGHREDGGRVVREPRRALRVLEHGFPDAGRTDRQNRGQEQADGAAGDGALGRAVLPEHRHEQHREVARAGDREGQHHHVGDVFLLEGDAEHDGEEAEREGRALGPAQFGGAIDVAMAPDRSVEVVRHGGGARQRQAGDHGENRREGDRRDEAEEQIAADGVGQMHGRHVAAALQALGDVAIDVERGRIRNQVHDRAEADDEGQDVEVADPGRRPGHRLAGFLGVRDGEEAHQDVRQAGGAEHQRHADGDRRNRILDQRARAHDGVLLRMHFGRLGEQRLGAEAELEQHCQGHEGRAAEQHAGLDDLHPGRRRHAAEQHVHHHDRADENLGDHVVEAEENLDQLTGADHLGDHVERHDDQRADGREGAQWRLGEAVRSDVGEGELAEVAQAFRHQEGDDGPADQPADREDQAVEAVGEHQAGNAEERGRRHVVAGDREAVLEAGDAAAGGVEVGRGLGLRGRPLGDPEGGEDEDGEHDDGRRVDRLLGCLTEVGTGGVSEAGDGHGGDGRENALHVGHLISPRRE